MHTSFALLCEMVGKRWILKVFLQPVILEDK